MIELWTVVGYALIPFVAALAYAACDSAGSRPVPWVADVLALIVVIAIGQIIRFAIMEPWLVDGAGLGALGTLVSAMVGLVSMFVTLPMTYRVVYALTRPVTPQTSH